MSPTDPAQSPKEQLALEPLAGLETQVERVHDRLRRALLDHELTAGQLYSVVQLAVRFKVSRTPVREAVLRLAQEGMVRLERNRGFSVIEPEAHEVQDIFEIRWLLEPSAARRAVENLERSAPVAHDLKAAAATAFEGMASAVQNGDHRKFWEHDREFHLAILKASGNKRLEAMVDGLRDLMLLRDATLESLGAGEFRDVAEEHQPILAAINARDAGEAERAMRKHIEGARARVVRYERRHGDLP